MTNYAALVAALYDKLGTWQAVADACQIGADYFAPNYYRKLARNMIKKPGSAAMRGIWAASEKHLAPDITRLYAPTHVLHRKCLVLSPAVFTRLEAVKIAHGLTWDALLDEAARLLESPSVTPAVTDAEWRKEA